jgi:molecular chaperone IbpA
MGKKPTQIDAAAAETGPLVPLETPFQGFRTGSNANHVARQENRPMRVDFSPLYRSTIGFDRLFGMLDQLGQPDNGTTYPPYNIERTGEDSYRISMAVAGFSEADIDVQAHRNVLTVKGERKEGEKGEGSEVLYRGIAARAFERRFQLADHVDVVGASLKNGLLHIDLKRSIPEELKPRKIAITNGANGSKQIEAKAAH